LVIPGELAVYATVVILIADLIALRCKGEDAVFYVTLSLGPIAFYWADKLLY
jgi:hypothetical protein